MVLLVKGLLEVLWGVLVENSLLVAPLVVHEENSLWNLWAGHEATYLSGGLLVDHVGTNHEGDLLGDLEVTFLLDLLGNNP